MTDRQLERLAALRRAAASGRLSQIEWAFVEAIEERKTKTLHPITLTAFMDLWARALNRDQETHE